MTDVLPADEVLRLPDPQPPARRSPIPLVASVVPVLASVGLWAVTGTVTMLWFAALGPLIALASLADGARAARRQRRLAARDAERMRRRVGAAVAVRHADERARMWARTPDMLTILGDDEVWRPAAGRGESIVVGRGSRRSGVRVEGGREDAASAAVREAAAVLDDAPVTVPLCDGVAVVGPEAVARAVQRALVLQLCHVLPPDRLRVAMESGDGIEREWLRALPHTRADAALTLALSAEEPGDIAILRLAPGAAVPPRCAAVLALTGIDRARLAHDGTTRDVRIEGVGHDQARRLADALRDRAGETYGDAGAAVSLADLVDRSAPRDEGLDVVIGTSRGGVFRVDLVADGPHAVIAGITGSGKSELLTTWITALCTRYGTDRVNFLLADFKGGTAFDALAALPHVTGVITDLDAGGAARALESLRAELRRREAEIVRAGTHDVVGTALPRLVIVVDEYAALTAAHPDLVELFTDIAARGRALGMHLILGTQRAAGTFRDALLANCPLRISLRVADAADSRTLIGTADAAALSGGPEQRGIALVRRAMDAAARPVRIALSSSQLVADAASSSTGPAPRRPWLPALPERIPLAGLRAAGLVLGVADEPEHQRQPVVTLAGRGLSVIGRAGSGRTTALGVVAAQCARHLWIGADPEAAWDAIAALDAAPAGAGVVRDGDDTDAGVQRDGDGVGADGVRDGDGVGAGVERDGDGVGADGVRDGDGVGADGVRDGDGVGAGVRTGVVTTAADVGDAGARVRRDAAPTGADVVIVDDLDALLARLPADYAHEVAERVERIVHAGGAGGPRLIVSAQRVSGPVGRIVDLLPQRAILATATRADFAAAGGAPHDWRDGLPPGRGILDGRLMQFAVPPGVPSPHEPPAHELPTHEPPAHEWVPCATVTGVLAAAGPAQRRIADAATRTGARPMTIDQAESDAGNAPGPVVVIGDGEQWQRAWRMLQAIRLDGELVVDAASGSDYRMLTGDRALLPYCVPGRGRAWLIDAAGAARRVVIA